MPSEFESINEALIACVKACGGSKQVGNKLWPEKTIDAAQRHLLACLNEDKPERLSPEQLVLLMRMGHAAPACCSRCSAERKGLKGPSRSGCSAFESSCCWKASYCASSEVHNRS